MMAIGFVLFVICIGRMFAEIRLDWVMPQQAKWKWGLTLIISLALIVASAATFLWERMP